MGVARDMSTRVSACFRDVRGQMTVEMAVVFPVLIVVAVIAVNACTFFYECAVFDRVVHDAVRVYATAPGYGGGADSVCADIEGCVRVDLPQDNIDISVSHAVVGADFDEYRAVLEYHPTLFGMGLRSEVFGVSLPALSHTTSFVVDCYRPGVIV